MKYSFIQLILLTGYIFGSSLVSFAHAAPTLTECNLDGSQSLIQIRVYKEGPLAALGDNHIISTRKITDNIQISHQDIQQSNIELALQVKDLVVNDPELRAKAEDGFNSKVSGVNRRFTRKQMLGPKVLDADQYPTISIVILNIPSNSGEQGEIQLDLHGQKNTEIAEIHYALEDDVLTTSGQLLVSQKRYGIKPFSILFGGIRVKDQLKIDYQVTAKC